MNQVMYQDVTEIVANFRKTETDFDLLWEMYHNSGFTDEGEYGFGYKDEKSGLKAIFPSSFYKMWNGSWLDPGRTRWMSVEELQGLLEMKIDCRLKITYVLGHFMTGPDGKNWFVLPGAVESWKDDITDILLTVEWNVMDDPNAQALSKCDVGAAVGEIVYWHEEEDPRDSDGMQYIVLPIKRFQKLKNIWTYEWKQLLMKANYMLDEFDAHKAEYKEKFVTKVVPLVLAKKNYRCMQTDDDITIVYTDAFMNRYKHRFRYDEIGWQACLKEYDFLAELRD